MLIIGAGVIVVCGAMSMNTSRDAPMDDEEPRTVRGEFYRIVSVLRSHPRPFESLSHALLRGFHSSFAVRRF